ncbi:hypothetical protein ACNHYB_10455 [Isoptericola jiangsuensis]|uniref:hypothetical protein n=1 Tax=Isoptericola jiangsuensis TaxID=548579 RepID=UPI003AAEBB9D
MTRSPTVGPARAPGPADLRAAWEHGQRLATAPGAVHHWCDGEHGWMLRAGLDRTLAPVLLPDADSSAGFSRFDHLGPRTARDLLRRLPPDYLAAHRQNDGPTIGAVLRAVVAHPGRVLAHGYVVGPLRCDERVTVEGVLLRSDDDLVVASHCSPWCQCDVLGRLAAACGVDDALVPAHEVTRTAGPQGPPAGVAEHWYRLWWD